jgi:ppGpp synthetase/RelA/SpoT-type nucleotidyltranferase
VISTSVSTYRSTIEPSLDKLIDFVATRLKSDLHGLNVEGVTSRKKSMESIQQKLQAGKVASIGDLRDLAGVTVVLLYRHEIPEAIELLKQTDLQVDDPGPIQVEPSNFRFHEPKLFVRPPLTYLERHELDVEECEVQFTTSLQHALDKATHDFDYKGHTYSWSNFRLVAQLRGILEMVDRTIDGIESVNLADDPTVKTPQQMIDATALLPLLDSHFAGSMPEDRRRFAETVLAWITAAGITAAELDATLQTHSDLVRARSLDPTSATLGSILRDHATPLVERFVGCFLITSELETLCSQTAEVPDSRRVTGLSSAAA